MLTAEDKARFERDGFLLVPGVLDATQVAELRKQLSARFATKSPFEGDIHQHPQLGSVLLDPFTRYPELRWLLGHPPMLSALRSLLGDDFVYVPEAAAHRGGFGTWHKDSTSQERAGETFHWEPDFLVVETVIYLQDNDPDYAGGLDVVPGSHLTPDTYIDNLDKTIWDKARTKLKKLIDEPKKGALSIPSKAGDLVMFHFRMDHKASWPRVKTPPPPDKEKLALFLTTSRNNAHAKAYRDYIRSRPDYHYMRGHRYPDDFLEVAREARYTLQPAHE